MIIRPGRLLPSVIVGAVLTGALALGAGTASAADPVDGDPCYVGSQQGIVGALNCVTAAGAVLGPLTEAHLGTLPATDTGTTTTGSAGTDGTGTASGTGTPGTTGASEGTGNTGSADGSGTTTTGSAGATTTGGTGTTTTTGDTGTTGGGTLPASVVQQPLAPAPALPAPDVRGVPAAAAFSAPGGLAARIPTLHFGAPSNPALLMAPIGSPLRTLATPGEGSPVTTSSDVQAMAFDNLPGGLGTPAVTGAVILSALGAFALRHRVLRRARLSPAGRTSARP